MDSKLDLLLRSFTFYISSILSIIRYFLTSFSRFKQIPSAFTVSDTCISLYFRLLGLSPVSIHVDDETTLHFWASRGRSGGRDRKPDDERPNLVMIHGKCGDSRWQFMYQVGHLSRRFDLYIPDLLFFGKSKELERPESCLDMVSYMIRFHSQPEINCKALGSILGLKSTAKLPAATVFYLQ